MISWFYRIFLFSWIGVPAWKRNIIEKKEAAEKAALGIA
jgi:hypothetical protein